VALVQDSYLVCEGLEQLLGASSEVEVVASCADRDSLLAAVESERPDVMLTDIRMPPDNEDDGIRVVSGLRESHPDLGVVVLSQHAGPGLVLRLFEDGSDGRAYLLKERIVDRAQLVGAAPPLLDTASSLGS
jgi:DNA-binding NarL/FixJ family response regulator